MATGQLLWKYVDAVNDPSFDTTTHGGYVVGFTGSGKDGERCQIFAAKTGKIVWRAPIGETINGPIYDAAFIDGRLVMVGEDGFYYFGE